MSSVRLTAEFDLIFLLFTFLRTYFNVGLGD